MPVAGIPDAWPTSLGWRSDYAWPIKSSRMRAKEPTARERWPCSGSTLGRGVGMWPASHSPCATGTMRSWGSCQTATGTEVDESSKPHGRMRVRLSSNQRSRIVRALAETSGGQRGI